MIRFTAIRLVEIAALLLLLSFVIYALIGLMPGDPIDLMRSADPRVSAADVARLKAVYGLDRPLVDRYFAWLGQALQGELGYSRLFAAPVWASAAAAARQLAAADGVELRAGAAAGAGARHRRRAASGFAARYRDQPVLFRRHLGADLLARPGADPGFRRRARLAAGERHRDGRGAAMLGDRLRHLVLPVATLTLASVGGYTRYMRAAMREALAQDHIRTARAKGASEARIVLHHAMRSALMPVTTILALSFGGLVSGALVTETMFAYPGMGKLIFDAVMGNDYNLALAALLLAAVTTMLANLAADLAYAWLDPRVSYR